MAIEGADNLRRIARQLRDATEEHGRAAASDIRERGGDTKAELARLWSQLEDLVEDRVRPAARDASRGAARYAREGRDVAIDARDRLRSATAAHPLLALGIAAATAWAVASLLSRRR